jgi:hypothetical protein
MRIKALSLAVFALCLAMPAQAQEAAVFKPTGNWTADYGDDYCRLIRTFSDGQNELALALERTQPGQFVRLVFVGSGIKPYRSADQLGYRFLPAGAAAKARFAKSETADGKDYFISDPLTLVPLTPPPAGAPAYDRAAELTAAQGVTAVALSDGLATPVRLETGPLGAPIGAMQACTDDLLKVWGLDPEKHKTMTAPAMPNPDPNGVLPMGTIPFDQFGKFVGGANDVRLMIGVDGKPTSCTTRSPSLPAKLNERICELLMKKATFQPAKDAGGQPMASYWMGPPLAFGPPPPSGR